MTANGVEAAVPWWDVEPGRLDRDREDVGNRFPELVWDEPATAIRNAGGWSGRIAVWPFAREQPAELARVGPGLLLQLVYPQAYPVIAPSIYPLDPSPETLQLTDHRWHLNGDGSLCLLQSADQWSARDSVAELLVKAAAWRIEYALMQAGLIEAMTEAGIVSTGELDPLISELPATADSGGPGSA